MNNYFRIYTKDKALLPSAFAPKDSKFTLDLIPELDNTDVLPFELDLVILSIGRKGLIKSNNFKDVENLWLDLMPNSMAFPLMSNRLKEIIDRNLTGNEHINWIHAKIHGNGEEQIYYIPRFEKMLDVLDVKNTIYVEGTDHIIKPCFSITKISNYSIFHEPSSKQLSKITLFLYVNENIKREIIRNNLIGVGLEKIKVY
jgi:hypothetical protein